jgi:hypothetical protein
MQILILKYSVCLQYCVEHKIVRQMVDTAKPFLTLGSHCIIPYSLNGYVSPQLSSHRLLSRNQNVRHDHYKELLNWTLRHYTLHNTLKTYFSNLQMPTGEPADCQ